jgi:ribosome recycling factor
LNAIKESGICINPQQEGTMVYLPLPKITKEHRDNLSKNAKMLVNNAKSDLKSIQNHFMKQARNQKQQKISEDLIFNACENIKYLVEEANVQCDLLLEEKLKQLLQ